MIVLCPNPNFLTKNESPSDSWDSITIFRLRDEEGGPHSLCPVHNLEIFVSLSKDTKSCKLFVNTSSLELITINKLRGYMCMLTKLSNLGVFLIT